MLTHNAPPCATAELQARQLVRLLKWFSGEPGLDGVQLTMHKLALAWKRSKAETVCGSVEVMQKLAKVEVTQQHSLQLS
jgi:hypothetical protein